MPQREREIDIAIIGAGITGLSASVKLGRSSTIFEKSDSIGGLVRSHQTLEGFWFDHVLHLLHIRDKEVELFVQELLGVNLNRCYPKAWVQTDRGLCRFPIQLNLGGLDKPVAEACVKDILNKDYSSKDEAKSDDYRQYLLDVFGKSLCELFYFPYNSKQWKVPLGEMSASGQLWNIHKPDPDAVLEGFHEPNVDRITYNSYAYYPIPDENGSERCMGQLTSAMAERVENIQLENELVEIDLENKTLQFANKNGVENIHYNDCISTIPLTQLIRITKGIPEKIKSYTQLMDHIKVISLAICIKGPRKNGIGHWIYFSNPDIPFTRLIFMTEFDSKAAPEYGWSILVETTAHQSENTNLEKLKKEVLECLKELNFLEGNHEVLKVSHWAADPAYVIFRPKHKERLEAIISYYNDHGIFIAGRYGCWEYSSMYNNIRNGFSIAKEILERR